MFQVWGQAGILGHETGSWWLTNMDMFPLSDAGESGRCVEGVGVGSRRVAVVVARMNETAVLGTP